jgi:hypothetical protein
LSSRHDIISLSRQESHRSTAPRLFGAQQLFSRQEVSFLTRRFNFKIDYVTVVQK